ncbi:MAG TPA: hypothetical protein PK765_05525 [bacterium]|nr:hypothetical protein [bacterium]
MIAFELSEICLTTFNTFDPARDAASLHIEEARKKVRKLTQ